MSLSKLLGNIFSKNTEAPTMPPAISDDESSDVDAHLPVASWREDDDGEARPPRRAAAAAKPTSVDIEGDEDEEEEGEEQSGEAKAVSAENGDEDDDDEGDEGDEGDEDVYIVEAIKKHMIDEDGTLKFHVKWEGYEKKADMTWEPELNLEESANEILEDYFNKIGGRDSIFKETAKALSGKKRGRKGSSAVAGGVASVDATPVKRSRKSNGAHPSQSTPPASTKPWSPPSGSWEDAIQTIDACHDEGSGNLMVYLVWKNGKKTKHTTQVIYAKCPQKMLQFYEQHIKIVKPEDVS